MVFSQPLKDLGFLAVPEYVRAWCWVYQWPRVSVIWYLGPQLAFVNEMEMNSERQFGSGGMYHDYDKLTSLLIEVWVSWAIYW